MNIFERMRFERGLSVSAVADHIGCSRGAVRRLEEGKTRRPDAKIVLGLSTLLELDVAEVLRLAERENDAYLAELDAPRAVTA